MNMLYSYFVVILHLTDQQDPFLPHYLFLVLPFGIGLPSDSNPTDRSPAKLLLNKKILSYLSYKLSFFLLMSKLRFKFNKIAKCCTLK